MKEVFQSWGLIKQEMEKLADGINLAQECKNLICFGSGRSYGDVALKREGMVIQTKTFTEIYALDESLGIVHCDSGVTLDSLLKFIVPKGFFIPVSPGTKFVTIGGAIANNIHGKNHHKTGSWGDFVISFDLHRSNGEIINCSPSQNADYFSATIGGIGMTGIIRNVKIKVMPIESSYIDVEKITFSNLEEYILLNHNSLLNHAYTVAWFDASYMVKNGGQLRGTFMQGNHSSNGGFVIHPKPLFNIPFSLPNFMTSKFIFDILNILYFWKEHFISGHHHEHYNTFFYPLDFLGNWNRGYGKNGFYQYQPIVPHANFKEFIKKIAAILKSYRQTSFVSVLKTMGDSSGHGHISFSRPGITICLDFKNNGATTKDMMMQLNALTEASQGVVNPSKDAFMNRQQFLNLFQKSVDDYFRLKDPGFSSDFIKRVTT